MTASAPDAPRMALAARLSCEMQQAEAQGFRTATAWLTREETDLICAALRQAASARDTVRLDFLDRCAAAMTAGDRAERGWALSIEPDRLTLDALAGPHPPQPGADRQPACRDAIDARLAELERARSGGAPDEGSARKPGRPRSDREAPNPTPGTGARGRSA